MIGQKFGRLTVLASGPVKHERYGNFSANRSQWLCVCECGNERIVAGNKFKQTVECMECTGKTNKEHFKQARLMRKTGTYKLSNSEHGQVGFNKLLRSYKRNAEKRRHVWQLTDEEFRTLTTKECFYCGITPTQTIDSGAKAKASPNTIKSVYTYNGIDRKENSIGYTSENCVSCCGQCNHMKGKMNYSVFIEHMRKIIERFGG